MKSRPCCKFKSLDDEHDFVGLSAGWLVQKKEGEGPGRFGQLGWDHSSYERSVISYIHRRQLDTSQDRNRSLGDTFRIEPESTDSVGLNIELDASLDVFRTHRLEEHLRRTRGRLRPATD